MEILPISRQFLVIMMQIMMIKVMVIEGIVVQRRWVDGVDDGRRMISFYDGHNMFNNRHHNGFYNWSTVYDGGTLVGYGRRYMDVFGHM